MVIVPGERKKYIDYAKGIGIILMIMGHIGFGQKFDIWIHSFHMPLFFVISGVLYRKPDDMRQHIRKRIRSLLVPYTCWGGVYTLLSLITVGYLDAEKVMHLLWENTRPLPITSVLWFFTALFFADIIFYFIMAFIKNGFWRCLLCIAVSLSGVFFATYLPYRLPWAIDSGMVGVAFFYLGYSFEKVIQKEDGLINSYSTIIVICILSIAASMFAFISSPINMREGTYGNPMLFFFVAGALCIVIIYWCLILEKKFAGKGKVFFRLLSYIGRKSIVFLCVNQPVISFVNKVFFVYKCHVEMSNIVNLLITILIITLITVLLNVNTGPS